MVAAGSITVAVRVRPPTGSEAARLPEPCYDTSIRGEGTLATPGKALSSSSVRDIVQLVDDRILTFDPPEMDPSKAFVERGFMPPGTKRYKDKRFMFDRVFGHDAQQTDVYDATAKPLLQPLLDGFNATIFAYGATGCGKTHTISGTESDPGVIYLTMADLFQRIEDRRDDWNVDVIVTFLEIYNEEIRDLLAEPGEHPAPRSGLQIREDKSVKVMGLTELKPKTAEEVKEIVILGNTRRTQSPTHANETSSRSHAVLQVHITQSPRTAAISEQRTMGTLSIIDLAGSERAAATSNMGQRMVEGANINKSLLALGNCINALCESGGAVRHVPYRNSKLTRLLKFSLGGNCKTVMVVCIAPTSLHFDDTHNTLLYAERATKIKTKVVTRNVVNVDRHVGRYVEAINRLNIEVAELKAKLAGRANSESDATRRKRAEANVEVDRAKKDLQTKAEHAQPSIVDGATCQGKLSAANAKLLPIRRRLTLLDAQAAAGTLSSDLEAERALLRSMAVPEESATKLDSALQVRLLRSNNSSNMFDAFLKAVSERRSDRLDTVSVENVTLDARARKAEMERCKAEARADAAHEALSVQAETVVDLVGMVGRCTVMLAEASRLLQAAVEDGRDGMESTVKTVAASLRGVADKNDESFAALVGHSTAAYAVSAVGPSSLNSFKSHATSFNPRVSSAPIAAQPSKMKPARRSSSYGAGGGGGSPRRAHKSPRKSARSSLSGTGAPSRRVPYQEKEKKKSVQWRDEAGRGGIDDGGDPFLQPSASVPTQAPSPAPPVAGPSSERLSRPNSALGGSESEWEDEKADEGASTSFMSSRDLPLLRGLGHGHRARPSRFEPGFLKSRGTTLGSLAEDDREYGTPRRSSPLTDINVNRMQRSGSPTGSGSSGSTISALHVPKARERALGGTPTKRQPGASAGGGGSGIRAPGSSAKAQAYVRRRSNVGPVRSEKGRRRSSMIPQPSPQNGDEGAGGGVSASGGPRRVHVDGTKSPGRRAKRVSLLGAAARSMKLRAAAPPAALLAIPPAMDPNSSADISFRSGGKPTWR